MPVIGRVVLIWVYEQGSVLLQDGLELKDFRRLSRPLVVVLFFGVYHLEIKCVSLR